MQFSTDYNALFRSHKATDNFDRADKIRLNPAACGFSVENAWWLSELCRWIYKHPLSPERSGPNALLPRVGLTEVGHYTASGIHCSLVLSTDKRYAVLVFRGTYGWNNWLTNANLGPKKNQAHRGWANAAERLWHQVEPEIRNISCPVYFTGHSMGGALATLTARYYPDAAGVYTFGSPALGSRELVAKLQGVPTYRVVNYRDMVTRCLDVIGLQHIGQLHYISWEHELWSEPSVKSVSADQRNGPREITLTLNQGKPLPIPEPLTDHAPQNYIAHLERLALPGFAEVPMDMVAAAGS